MNTRTLTIAALTLGMLFGGMGIGRAADPDLVQDVVLPPRPDIADYEVHCAFIDVIYVKRTYDSDGNLIREKVYNNRRMAEDSAFFTNRVSDDRHAVVVDVELPLQWALWGVYDLRWEADDVASFLYWNGCAVEVVAIAENPKRRFTSFTANDDMWLTIPTEGGKDFKAVEQFAGQTTGSGR